MSEGDCPTFSRCCVGKGRWFWVAYKTDCERWRHHVQSPPDASGYEATAEAAEAKAAAAAGPGARFVGASIANDCRRRKTVKSWARRGRADAPRGARHWSVVLGVRVPCSLEDVKAAYRRRSKEVHPDVGGDHRQFVALNRAYREAIEYCRHA